MAYNFTSASSQYLSTSSSPVSGTPLTMASWMRPAATGTPYLELQQNGGTDLRDRYRLLRAEGFNNPSSLDIIQANSITESPFAQASSVTTNTFTRNEWNHWAGVFTSASSRTAYLNGSAATTNTSTVNVRTPTRININAIQFTFGSNIAYGNGQYAEVGVWNVALTADEIASLADGMTCDKVRPQSLVFYAPLIRTAQDLARSLTLTNNNAATVADHPRVYA